MARHRDTERLAVEATAEVLATGRRRRSGWKLVSGRHVAELGGIDQVLVGPGGIFAVWSTWPSGRCSVEDGVVTGAVDPEPIARARQGARAVERWMHTGPLGLDAEVRPVVVMWGPGRIRFAEGWDRIDGVLVCDGQLDLTWLPELDATHLDQSRINDIADALADLSPRQVPSSVATEVPLVLSSRS